MHKSAKSLLPKEWLDRWHRSQAQFPDNLSEEEKLEFTKVVELHKQFEI